MKTKRKNHSAAFKAQVALEAIREDGTTAELARRHKLNANMIYRWKRELLDNITLVFDRDQKSASPEVSPREAELLRKIGELTMERDFLSAGLGR